MVRTMPPPLSGTAYTWSTPPSAVRNDAGPPQPEEPALRWEENFAPDVRVAEVRIKRVDPSGGETVLAPARLRVLDPASPAGDIWECPGEDDGSGGKVYKLSSSTACRVGDDPPKPFPVTPTYVVSNLTHIAGPPIVSPLVWEAELPGPTQDEVVIEFTLVNVACAAGTTCNALKAAESEKDLGPLQVDKPHRTVLEITNLGPEALRVGTVRMEAVAGYPDARGDFTITTLSDPQPVPVPVERAPDGRLRPGADFGTSPLIVSTTTANGDPVYTRALDTDGARVVVSGHALDASGDPQFEGHRIAYDDPAADFSWKPSQPGVRRPFAEVAYLRRQPPFYVDPGHSFLVRLTVEPKALGHRRAYLGIGATADSNPAAGLWTRVLVEHEGISGPSLVFAPRVLSLPRWRLDAAGRPVLVDELSAFVSNYGNSPMSRSTTQITGPDAARFALASTHAATRTIPPGGDERFTVRYLASCAPPLAPPPALGPAQFEADLRVATDGGEAVIALRGEWCPQMSMP